jgi:CO/xanthine dehydrogenase Mo-binding subunit
MTELLHKEFSRKSFVKGSGALIVGFGVAGAGLAGRAGAATVPTSAGYLPPVNQVDSWLTVHSDNTVSFKSSQIELGNGVTTGLAMLVAEELDLSLAQVRHGPWDSWQLVNSGGTGGSSGIQTSAGPRLRAAAATARQTLLGLAATHLSVPVSSLSVANGVVSGGGRSVTYGQLVGGKLLNATIPTATLHPGVGGSKPVSQYKLIGTRQPRIGLPDKITGKHTYVHNIKVPGMWHARVVRPRGQGAFGTGAKILSVDASSIKNIPGAQVVRKGDFLAVVALREFDAIQAASQLKVTWKEDPILPTSGNVFKQLREHDSAGFAPARYRMNTGNVDAALQSSAHTVSQTYQFHYGSRAVIGPSAAVADVRRDSAVIFSSTQAIHGTTGQVATLLGMRPENVRTYFYEGASSFGNALSRGDVAKAAALTSQLVGKPVKMQFMRWDEHGWDNFQQAMLVDVRAGIDANGKLVAYDYTLLSQPYSTAIDVTSELIGDPYPNTSPSRIDDPSVGDAYTATNKRLHGKTADVYKGYFRTSSHVSGGSGQQSAFATEQAIDELAYAARIDPVEFRRQNISDDAWLMALNAAAIAAKWQPRVAASNLSNATVVTGRGVGIGSHGSAARSAAVVDIEVNRKTGKITVKHVYNGIEAGLAVNPEGIENQMTGMSIMGVSRALHEQVTFNKTRVTSLDWVTYPILRFADAPKVTNLVPQRTDRLPRGVGEPPITPIPGAVANAFFDATGVRIRQAPMTPAVVRGVLKAAGKVA